MLYVNYASKKKKKNSNISIGTYSVAKRKNN